jgi:hypothetical protein
MFKRFASHAAALLFMVPVLVLAQQNDVESDSGKRWLRPPDERHAYVRISNNWRDTVKLTLWTRRGTQVGEYWTIRPGQSGFLKESGQRITASPEYIIKVGDDQVSTSVGAVGQRRGDTWYLQVTDIWRMSHPGGTGNREGIDQHP